MVKKEQYYQKQVDFYLIINRIFSLTISMLGHVTVFSVFVLSIE